MNCQQCNSSRIISISAKCSDLCSITYPNGVNASYSRNARGYVPEIENIGSGDYIKIQVCLECGQVQGKFPVTVRDGC